MLPPFIIDQIRRREEEVADRLRRGQEQPRLELPLVPRDPAANERREREEDVERGVVILDLG